MRRQAAPRRPTRLPRFRCCAPATGIKSGCRATGCISWMRLLCRSWACPRASTPTACSSMATPLAFCRRLTPRRGPMTWWRIIYSSRATATARWTRASFFFFTPGGRTPGGPASRAGWRSTRSRGSTGCWARAGASSTLIIFTAIRLTIFLTVGPRNGRRIAPVAAPGQPATGAAITTFLDRRFYEHDLTLASAVHHHPLFRNVSLGPALAGRVI